MIPEQYILLLLVAVAITAGIQLDNQDHRPAVTSVAEQGFDQFIDQPRWSGRDSRGQPDHSLSAERLEHYPARQASLLHNPRLQTAADKDPVWTATAKQAWLPDQGQPLTLQEKVVVTVETKATGAQKTLTTEQLQIDTALNQASTDFPVRIKTAHSLVTGTGLRADLGSHRLLLHHQVRTTHDSNTD